MSWTTTNEVNVRLRRLWDSGALLRCLVDQQTLFPLRIPLKGPAASELTQHFEPVRAWIAELRAVPQLRLESRHVKHRVLGEQQIPRAVWIDDLETALTLIGKRGGAAKFRDLVALTRESQPHLLAWLARRPLPALELGDVWGLLLAVVAWLRYHPRPGIYLRQVSLPGIHTKLIEAHRGVLSELLDLTLPPEAIDASRTGIGQFAQRYGFIGKPTRIRFRVLDARIELLAGVQRPDLAVDAQTFASLALSVRRVFITENETNFLAFPPADEAIVIFGAGYGWDALAEAVWLNRCAIYYWGDIDTHGFAILHQLRAHFGHVESFLMDRATLMTHQSSWGEEPEQVTHDLPRLTTAEQKLFDELRDNRIRRGLRLEQERVDFAWVEAALNQVEESAQHVVGNNSRV